METTLLHELALASAYRTPDASALCDDRLRLSYAQLATEITRFAGAMTALGVTRGARVAVYLDKRVETVIASFGASAQGAVFVPINPLLKPEQVGYILRDCGVCTLVTSGARLEALNLVLMTCPDLAHVVVVDSPSGATPHGAIAMHPWTDLLHAGASVRHRVVDQDIVGDPVYLGKHRQTQGRRAVASQHGGRREERRAYLENRSGDALLAALPLSFDAGFSQLTTAFHVGRPRGAAELPAAERRAQGLCTAQGDRPDRRAAAVDSAGATELAGRHRRAPALLCEYRRPHATGNVDAAARALPERKTVSHVWADRSVSLDLPAAGRG